MMANEQPKIGDIAEVVTQMLTDDKSRDDFYRRVDEAVECIFEPDPAIKALPWVGNRHHGNTKIADAHGSASRVFSTLLPDIQINPNNDDEYEYHRCETAEQVLEWEFAKMNRVVGKPVHVQSVEDAVKYHAVAFQVEDLVQKYKDKKKIKKTIDKGNGFSEVVEVDDPRISALLRMRRFNWVRQHPGTVHSQSSDALLERVAKVSDYSMQTLIDNFGRDNPGVVKLLEKHPNAKPAELMRIKYTLVDYMDWTDRVQFAQISSGGSVPRVLSSNDDIVFMNEKHGLPFLNWVVVKFGDPLWKSLIQSGQWDNLQYLGLIRFAKAVEQGTRSTMMARTPDGTLQRIWVDFSNPSNMIVVPLDGTEVSPLPTPPIDPQLETQYQEMAATADRSTVARILQDASSFTDAPFSTFNAATNNAIAQLNPAKATVEMAEMQGFLKIFEWIEYSNKPLMGYRTQTSDSRVKENDKNARGSIIGIYPGPAPKNVDDLPPDEYAGLLKKAYFDLEALYLTVTLRAFNQSDEQARMNTQILAIEKMGISKRTGFEKMGWKNYQLEKDQRAQEMLDETELQVAAGMKQLKLQQAQAQMQMQMQQAQAAQAQQAQAPQNAVNDLNAANQFASMQGAEMRGGGNPAAPVAPNETREQITGQSAGGEGIV